MIEACSAPEKACPRAAAAVRATLSRRLWLRGTLALSLFWSPHAQALETPTGPVVLTLSGRIRIANAGAQARFDMAMLAALPNRTLETRTPWYGKVRRFTGPLLRDVLAAAGAQGSKLRLLALNEYQVDMPWDDALRYDVIVARLLDGAPMAVRDKGPLFVVYPFDAQPELRSAIYYSRSAWQLKAIEIL